MVIDNGTVATGFKRAGNTIDEKNRVGRWFRKLKDRTKRLCSNINSKSITATAALLKHNLTIQNPRGSRGSWCALLQYPHPLDFQS
ncbi:MAG: hypothetical protein QXH17_03420 [Candidatus Bathyarchaeia archaeon]